MPNYRANIRRAQRKAERQAKREIRREQRRFKQRVSQRLDDDLTDELEEVVSDEFGLCEEFRPPGPEVSHVANVSDGLLVGERAHRVRAVAVLGEPLHVDGVLAEEAVARLDAHRDRVRPAGQAHLEAVEHDVHVDLAAAPVAPNLAEHHLAQRRPVDGLLAEDLLQRPVDFDRVGDRVAVSGNVEQRVHLRVIISGLLPGSTRLDER